MSDAFNISNLDMTTTDVGLAVTEGTACDPPYLYVTPHNGYVIAKIDTRSFTVVDTLDLSEVDNSLTGMLGSFVVGGYLYILPHLSNAGPIYPNSVVRVDLSNFAPEGCTTLKVMDASDTLSGLGGLTDGVNGYINMTVNNQLSITRFGLGANFNAASVSMVTITQIDSYPVVVSQLVSVDKEYAYSIATVMTSPGVVRKERLTDLWLVKIPTANFTASAATMQRLTKVPFVGSTPRVYVAVDDGRNLWLPPMVMQGGPMLGTTLPTLKIPKANPAAVVVPKLQPTPTNASPPFNGATSFYDGWRYGYFPSQNTAAIYQLDTQSGKIAAIDISASSAGAPMYGLGYDGKQGYAVSFNGGAGLCLRFTPTQSPVASNDCPCCEPV